MSRVKMSQVSFQDLTPCQQLRIGRIHYLNTLPFYHGMDRPTWVPTKGSPAEINLKMRAGEIDIAPISSLEYLHHPSHYLLFPEICIGARDFSGSVLLFSRERIEGLEGATIALTHESLSAQALLKILLKLKYGFKNRFRTEAPNPEEMLKRSEACLAIGDTALFYRPKEFVYKTDLCELWWDWTGLPFCFAVWAVRRKCYTKNPEGVHHFYEKLKGCLKENLQDLEKLLREGAGMTITDDKFATVFGYLFNLSYGLDSAMEGGLKHFFKLAHRAGLSPRPRRFEFIDEGVTKLG